MRLEVYLVKLLKELYRSEDLNLAGRTISREAARAIILQDDEVLMVYSPVNKDYKFPGGGIKEGESHQEALLREVREECGVILAEIRGKFGLVVEYARPREVEYDVYRQNSYYYLCRVHPEFIGQSLDDYEQCLGLRPEWVGIGKAVEKNRSVLKGNYGEPPVWTRRDTYVLSKLGKTGVDVQTCDVKEEKERV